MSTAAAPAPAFTAVTAVKKPRRPVLIKVLGRKTLEAAFHDIAETRDPSLAGIICQEAVEKLGYVDATAFTWEFRRESWGKYMGLKRNLFSARAPFLAGGKIEFTAK